MVNIAFNVYIQCALSFYAFYLQKLKATSFCWQKPAAQDANNFSSPIDVILTALRPIVFFFFLLSDT